MKPLEPHNNPNNPENITYKKLTKFFSGPIVNYKTQNVRNHKRQQLDKYSTKFVDVLGNKFQKSSNNRIFQHINSEYLAAMERGSRYTDFEQMEYDPILASALDIYADEMTTHNQFRKILNIKCTKDEIKTTLEALFYDVLNVEYNLHGWCRDTCKYGDKFMYLEIDPETGVRQMIGLRTIEVERIEGRDESNANYTQFRWNSANAVFENWQVAHFRFLGNDKYAPLGTSVLDPARRVWRQLTLLEDTMMSYRITRSSEKKVFYMDVRGVPPQDREQYILDQQKAMKQNQVIDPTTGKVDLRYNAMSVEDDYFIPVMGPDDGTKIETLAAGQNVTAVEDIQYVQDRLFAAIKIPKTYLIRGEGGEEEKGTLAQKDVRFAHTIMRLQQAIVSELRKVATIHLWTLGYRGEDLLSFDINLNNPSKISELQELEAWKQKFDVASSAPEFMSERWKAEHLLGMSNEEFFRNRIEKMHDVEFNKKVEGEQADGAGEGGGGGFDPFGDLGADGGEDLGDPMADAEMPAEGGEPTDAPDDSKDDSMLLAAPAGQARRADGRVVKAWTTTPASKGKVYGKAKVDNRDNGARTRSFASQAFLENSRLHYLRPNLGGKRSLLEQLQKAEEASSTIYPGHEQELAETEKLIRSLEKISDDSNNE